MRGRWAQGLEPRGFTWVIKDRLAASERPGGFARHHRKVRRQEELIWLAGNGFTHVLSLLDTDPRVDAPLYRFPVFGFFALSIAAAALGNARGAIDARIDGGGPAHGAPRSSSSRSRTSASR